MIWETYLFLYCYLYFFNHCISIFTIFILFIPWTRRVRLSNPSLQYYNHQSYLPPYENMQLYFLMRHHFQVPVTWQILICQMGMSRLMVRGKTYFLFLRTCKVNCSADSIYLRVSNDEAKMTSSPRTGINPRISAQTKIKTLVWFGLKYSTCWQFFTWKQNLDQSQQHLVIWASCELISLTHPQFLDNKSDVGWQKHDKILELQGVW